MGRNKAPPPMLQESMELWTLAQMGLFSYDAKTVRQMPVKRLWHFMGFQEAKREMEKKEMEREKHRNMMNRDR